MLGEENQLTRTIAMTLETYLKDLKAITENATAGPWGYCYDGSSDWSVGRAEDPQDNPVCGLYRRHAIDCPDAEFIAASRTALPKLISIVEVLMDVVERHKNKVAFEYCGDVFWPLHEALAGVNKLVEEK